MRYPAGLARQRLPVGSARDLDGRLKTQEQRDALAVARPMQQGSALITRRGRQSHGDPPDVETTAYIALSRQMVLRHRMDVIAHNVANANTTGFKAESVMLEPVVERSGRRDRLAFVQDFATVRDSGSGPVITTNNPFDLAIEGAGYFMVETAEGVRYTRAGQFQLNDLGELVTSTGDRVLDDGGNAIVLPDGAREVAISSTGMLSAADGAIARLGLVSFPDEQALRRIGGGLYDTDQAAAPAPARTRLLQGALEGSNVQAVVEMTDMMEVSRAYQSTQRLIEGHHETQRRTIERMLETTK